MAADGNMGSLWVSLGIKDAFTKGLKQLEAELKNSKKNTDNLQQSLNDIGKGLSGKAGLGESIASVRKFQELLKSSETDLKGFVDVFSKISDKDLSKLFGNKINATNAQGILNVLKSINFEIGNMKKYPGDILDGLFGKLNKYIGALSNIVMLKNEIANATAFSGYGMSAEFTALASTLKSVRSEMISLFNEGKTSKGKKYEELLKVRSDTLTEMCRAVEKLYDLPDPLKTISESAKSATKELEKTASTAKKTAEDVKQAATTIKSSTEGTKLAPVQTENVDKATAKIKEAGTAAKETSEVVQKAATSLNKILNQFQGKDARNLSLEEASKNAMKYMYQLININNQLRKAEMNANSEDGDKGAFKSMRTAVDNAIKYLGIIRDISLEYKKIDGKKVENPNIDTKKIEKAKAALESFYNEMLKLQDAKTGVDNAFVVGDFGKVFRMVKTDLKYFLSVFDKEKQRQAARDAELKSMDAYAKRYMELVAARDKAIASMKEAPGIKNDRGLQNISNEIDTLLGKLAKVREDISLYNQAIGTGTKEGISFGQQGLKEANAEAEHLMSSIENLQRVYDTLRNSQAHVGDLTGNSFSDMRSRDILAKMSEYYRAEEKASAKQAAKDEADARRKAAKAVRDEVAAEKQRQRELENSKNRVQSLEKALKNLQEKRFTSKSLGLDTSEADAKIKSMKEHVKELYDIISRLERKDMNAVGLLGSTGNGREVRETNELARQYDKANREVQRGTDLEKKRQNEIENTARKIQSELVKGFQDANRHAGGLNNTLQDIKALFLQGGLVFGAQQFAMSIITTGGEMEKQHIALQSILGDMQNANTLFGQIKELALNSPFTFSELNRDVKQLAAYGVEYDQLYDTTKRLADMSSGLGVSFDRIALAFGQVQARGWLDGKELRQIAYAGIPLLNKLSEFYSKREGTKVSTSDVKKRISNREVGFDDVKQIFWEMTDAGGQFYNMQQTLSETLLGRYNKLKDAWEIMLADFASGKSVVGGTFMFIIDLVTKLVQSMHSLGPVVAAAFSGFALTKFTRSFGAGAGTSFLANKAKISDEIIRRRLSGGKLNPYEQSNFVDNRGKITDADLKTLTRSGQLTKLETQRLFVNGKITKTQYEQTMAILKQKAALVGLNNKTETYSLSWKRVGLSIKMAGVGILGLGKSIFSMMGGVPGLILTGITMAVSYFMNKNSELKQAMEQTLDELKDRQKQMNDFRNSNNVKSIIAGGDTKAIDNTIDEYKEKLKELAPYDYDMLVMKANEKKSHADRLKYLDEQLALIQKANKEMQKRVSDKGAYSDIKKAFENSIVYIERYEKAKDNLMKFKPDKTQSDRNNFLDQKNLERFVENAEKQLSYSGKRIANRIKDMYRGMNVPKQELLSMQKQTIESFLAGLQLPEHQMKDLRLSIYEGLGIANDALKTDLGQRLAKAVSESMPTVADAIRSGRKLDDASLKKVKDIMKGCVEQMKLEYPRFSTELQRMLDGSDFQATVRLVYSSTALPKFTDAEQSLYNQYVPTLNVNGKAQREADFNKLISALGGVGKNASAKDLNDASQKHLQELWEVAESAKEGKYTQEYKNRTMKAFNDYKALHDKIIGTKFDPSYKGSNKPYKPGKDTQEDKELKNLKTRIDLYKKLYDEIKRTEDLYGKGGALGKLRNDGEFKSVFSDREGYPITDYTDYGKSIRQILGTVSASTADRVAYRNEQIAGIHSENRKIEEESIKNENDELGKQLDIISEEYEVYKKLYKLTGDRRGAASIAFGGKAIQSESNLEYLKGEVAKYLPDANKRSNSNLTIDDVMSMNQSDLNSTFGKDSKDISVAIDKLKAEQNKIRKETIDLMADIIEKNATIEQQIEDENRQYEYQKKLIEESNLSPEMKDRALKGLDSSHDENSAKLKFEKFKKDSDWVSIFDDLDRVSMNTITNMKGKIEKFSKTTPGLPVESVKNLREALSKLYAEAIKRNPMDAITNATSRGNAIGDILKTYIPSKDGKYTIGAIENKRTGLQEGTYTKTELENAQQGAYNDFDKGVTSLGDKFKALQDCLSPVINLFDALGMEDTPVGEAVSATSNALGAASQTASGLQALGLGSLGPYGAAASAALSFASSIFALHDKALQKEIEASERRQKEMENMTKNIKSVIENTLGGIYSYQASSSVKKVLNKVTSDYEKAGKVTTVNAFGTTIKSKSTSRYSEETYRAAKEAQAKPDSAYHAEWASLLAQRDELQKQSDSENKKKKKDKNKIDDYKQQLEEMDQQVKQFAQDFLKSIYSIDIKSWASELTDAVVSAWENGEDAVDSYKKKVRSLLKDVTKNIVSQKIIEAYMQKPLEMLTDTLKEKGKLDEDDIMKLANMFYSNAEDAADSVVAFFNKMKELGYDLRDDGSSSTSNSIKGITEETADILASYVNAIRLDVSVNRANIKDIADATGELPNITNLSKAQLSAMNQLVTLAQYRNDALDDMKRWMNQVTNGTKKISVA